MSETAKTQKKCETCKKATAEEMHTCPYQEEINDNDAECNCCDDCRQECLWEI